MHELAVDTAWDSVEANASDMPVGWHEFAPGVIKLKDTGSGFYKNRLVDPNTFRYELPRSDTAGRARMIAEGDRPMAERLPVRLYRVALGHDHFLGEWVVRTAVRGDQPHLVLGRLRAPERPPTVRAKRSRSEARHQAVLESIFVGMRVEFEPECASGLRTPYVENGVAATWASDFYTVDYVATDVARGRFYCIESKCDRNGLDDVAFKKCRRLRDVGLRRVVAIAGHGDDTVCYDFATCDADERWCSVDELRHTVA